MMLLDIKEKLQYIKIWNEIKRKVDFIGLTLM